MGSIMPEWKEMLQCLKEYDGPEVALMEVCGTHTASISENGIPDMLSPRIRLISGPGCPVCVTVAAYIDRLVQLSQEKDTCVVTFGDMIRVRGSEKSLRDNGAVGGRIEMVYSPLDTLRLAAAHPETTFVFAAVGFETTTPLYGVLLEKAMEKKLDNIRLLTALKTMPPAIDWVCRHNRGITGFIAPGHVSVMTGSRIYAPLAQRYGIPFAVAGFEGESLLAAIYALVQQRGRGAVLNFYPQAVTESGNAKAAALVSKYFTPEDSAWRGIGVIPGSGLVLREEYQRFDAGSRGLEADKPAENGCQCDKVIVGAISPTACPLFGTACTPELPKGACMVSTEGSCYNYFVNKRR